MSWMDSWSRPNKQSATPAPFYLTKKDVMYCHTCGRVISARRTQKSSEATPAKYCSSRCKSVKPGTMDRKIERVFVSILERDNSHLKDDEGAQARAQALLNKKAQQKKLKGDPRILVLCSEAEEILFGASSISGETQAWSTNDDAAASAIVQNGCEHVASGADRDARATNEDIENVLSMSSRKSDDVVSKRRQGVIKADRKESVKRAARRGCVFGFAQNGKGIQSVKQVHGMSPTIKMRKCEAVMQGNVVEPSFAKGDWSIRWREE